ncbi:MAG: integration host factor subunit beta [Bacteroidia bacterium]|nr:integration host factor subunit beta [Bacteroidia bacterium]
MTKAQIIQEIASKTGIDKSDVASVVEAFFRVVKNSLADGENVYFRGFGSFIVKKRAKKVARIISKNKSITIPAHFIPSFKPAKTFVDRVKNNYGETEKVGAN